MESDRRVWTLRAAMLALCLPSVLGTLVLASLAIVQRMSQAGGGLRGPSPSDLAFILLVGVSFLASAYGPLLLPLAVAAALVERQRSQVTDPIAWALLLLAVVAAIATYGWVLDAVELL